MMVAEPSYPPTPCLSLQLQSWRRELEPVCPPLGPVTTTSRGTSFLPGHPPVATGIFSRVALGETKPHFSPLLPQAASAPSLTPSVRRSQSLVAAPPPGPACPSLCPPGRPLLSRCHSRTVDSLLHTFAICPAWSLAPSPHPCFCLRASTWNFTSVVKASFPGAATVIPEHLVYNALRTLLSDVCV